jgi:hypothetical protein
VGTPDPHPRQLAGGEVCEGVNPAVYEEVNQMVYVEGLEEPS